MIFRLSLMASCLRQIERMEVTAGFDHGCRLSAAR
jgi:hypothetical protein